MSIKTERLGNIFVKEISEVIREDVDNEDIKNVTILSVKVSGDLSYAKVFVTFLGQGYHKRDGMEALNRSKGYIRSLLAKRMTTRKVPELNFVLDTSLDYGNHIEEIIKDINKDKE